jgi:glucose-1-phosphate thymidylyltransferase
MKAVILAATHDTRLGPHGETVPLPLIDLTEEPYLTTLVKRLGAIAGISSIHVVTNAALFPQIEAWAQSSAVRIGVPLHVANDQTTTRADQLGAIGDLRFIIAAHQLDDDLLIIGGENWISMPLDLFCTQAEHSSPAVLVTQVKAGVKPSRYGWVRLGPGSRIEQFVEQPDSLSGAGPTLKASCIYFLKREHVALLDDFASARDTHVTPGAFFAWLVESGQAVYGLRFDGMWYDLGCGTRPRGAEWLELREVLRKRVDTARSTWERRAARELQWVSSHEDLTEALSDRDINRSILAAELLGNTGHLLSPEGRQQVINALTAYVNDPRINDIGDSPFQMDEDDAPISLGKTAAAAIRSLHQHAENAR